MRNQIVILAAGKGTRMKQGRVPKVLAMLKDRPLICYVLYEIEKIGQLAKPVVVVGFQAQKVKGVLGSHYSYACQNRQLGTAHALMSAKPKIKAENILVLYGDMPFLKAETLKELIKMHLHGSGKISMLTAQVEKFAGVFSSLQHYGRILRDPWGNVTGIVEYKDATGTQKKIREINSGVYMFNAKWLWENIRKIKNNNAQNEYYLTDIVALAASHGEKIRTLLADPKEVIGINSREDMFWAEKLL